MTFNSFEFAAFLPVVVLVHWSLRSQRARLGLLLAASYLFYGWWDWRFCALIAVSTLVDFTVARRIASTSEPRSRKRWLWVSIATNLGILGFFKYFVWFADSAEALLESVGFADADWFTLEILLPVGISFYTFQTISYTFDVYRRRIEPTHSLLTFGVYVAFFPQLVAGPIERAQNLLPQFRSARPRPGREDFSSALALIFLGLFKKIVIADGVADAVNSTFDQPQKAGWATLIIAVVGFSLQIYGDFSGYTDIARGSARLLGIDLMENFAQPYLSRNITEFWRRWHISLSTWLRDYLYVPLGGNRGSRFATYRNLMITMALGGLWHGASWTFVIWGSLHGVALSAHRAFSRSRQFDETAAITTRDVTRLATTFTFVCLAWIFFRADTIGDAVDYLRGILTLRPGPIDTNALSLVVALGLAALAIDLTQRIRRRENFLAGIPAAAQGALLALAAVMIVVFSGGTPEPFIYFQF